MLLDSGSVVKEVEVMEPVELEASSHGDHLDRDPRRLVAEDLHKNRLHVAMSTHMFPQAPIVAVDSMGVAIALPHDLIPSLDRDRLYAQLDEIVRSAVDLGLHHASSDEWVPLEETDLRSQRWEVAKGQVLIGEDVPGHRLWNHAHHLPDADTIDDINTPQAEARLRGDIASNNDDTDHGHRRVMDRKIGNEAVMAVIVEATDALHHHPMTTEANNVLT